jgi:ATP-dependent DNA ligase
MDLPVMPPVSPMLAKLSRHLPTGDLFYEPKWDGFRCIVFRDGDEVELGSRNERPLTRYFPELVEALKAVLPERVVLDGEVVVAGPNGLEFDLLSQRIHPAASRVRMLAESTPSSFVAFDLLADGDEDLRQTPFATRRRRLEDRLGHVDGSIHLTPITRDPAQAADWFERFEGAGLDGVVAKAATLPYAEDQRVMIKVKHERTAEFVVAGFRWYKGGEGVGSLMLGLYDGDNLQHVGVIGAFPAAQRRELVEYLAPYRAAGDSSHPWAGWSEAAAAAEAEGKRLPGAQSRWNANKDLSFEPVRPELVVEAAYEHLQGNRLRHTARFRRWRPERDARSCTYEQLEAVVAMELADVFGTRLRPDGSLDGPNV